MRKRNSALAHLLPSGKGTKYGILFLFSSGSPVEKGCACLDFSFFPGYGVGDGALCGFFSLFQAGGVVIFWACLLKNLCLLKIFIEIIIYDIMSRIYLKIKRNIWYTEIKLNKNQ